MQVYVVGFVTLVNFRPTWRGGKGGLFFFRRSAKGRELPPWWSATRKTAPGGGRFYYRPSEPSISPHPGTATDAKRALRSAGLQFTAAGFGTLRSGPATAFTTQPLILNHHVIVSTPGRNVTSKTRNTIYSVFTKTFFHEFPFHVSGQRNPQRGFRHPSTFDLRTAHPERIVPR